MLRIALITDSKRANAAALASMAGALEANAWHCWKVWRDYLPSWAQDAPPSLVLWDGDPLPPWDADDALGHTVPLYFVDDSSRNPDTLAVHYVQGDRPAGRVYVERSTGLNTGEAAVSELASHEIVEMLVNPWIERWWEVPGREGKLGAVETADPVQTHYMVQGGGTYWRVANFVLPSWFGKPATLHAADGRVLHDYMGELSHPGEIGPEGYAIFRDRNWNVEFVFGAEYAGAREMGSVGKPLGRTQEIQAKVAAREPDAVV